MNRLVCLAVSLLVAPHLASAGVRPDAQAKIDQGNALYTAGDVEAALDAFRAAYQLDKQAAYSLATAYRLQGRCDLALELYREFINTQPGEQGVSQTKVQIADCVLSMDLSKPDDNSNQIVITQTPLELPWYKTPLGGASVIGTLGVASLAVGIGWMIASSTTRDEAEHAQFSDQFDRMLDEATGERRIGATFLVTGALITAGAFTYYLWKRPASPRQATALATDGRSVWFARSF